MIYEKTLLHKEYREQTNNPHAHTVTGCTCDICGEECFSDEIAKNNKATEYMELKVHWGYFSNHDLEFWDAQICEKCVVKHLEPLIKFRKREYNSFTGDIYEKDTAIINEEETINEN